MAHSALRLKAAAMREGFDLAGVCDASPPPHHGAFVAWLASGRHAGMDYMARNRHLRAHPDGLLPGVRSILAVGLNYSPPRDLELPRSARVARYAFGRDYHKVLRSKLRRVAAELVSEHPAASFRICVDSAPILERDFAHLAGLGWFGKNTCLINTKRGSWFVIGLLLTDVPFEADARAEGGCGTCSLCIDACPTGALVIEPDRPIAVLDSNRCISYLTIEHRGDFDKYQSRMVGEWIFGCDICQEVCPFNQPRDSQPMRAAQAADPDFAPREDNVAPSVDFLLIDDREFVRRYAGSAIMRAGLAGMRRNASASRS